MWSAFKAPPVGEPHATIEIERIATSTVATLDHPQPFEKSTASIASLPG
jgi:hypothetical protein